MKTYTLTRTEDESTTETTLIIRNISELIHHGADYAYAVEMNNHSGYKISRTEYYEIMNLIENEQ